VVPSAKQALVDLIA